MFGKFKRKFMDIKGIIRPSLIQDVCHCFTFSRMFKETAQYSLVLKATRLYYMAMVTLFQQLTGAEDVHLPYLNDIDQLVDFAEHDPHFKKEVANSTPGRSRIPDVGVYSMNYDYDEVRPV